MTTLRAAQPQTKSVPAGRRRTFAALGAVAAGLLVLTACDKPTPIATVTVGDNSVRSEAACYNDGNQIQAADLQKCLKNKDLHSIKVDPDATVAFGVEPEIADSGWTVLLNGQPLTDESNKTYRTIPGSVFFNQQYGATGSHTTVSILEGKGGKATGLWSFKLEKNS
ncbi:DUF2771 domain-containing protein [Streptomyces sp. NPDC058045]|uniref:DUF2771 domain-containing protein n=1 Tax=Streptomyces sp. NPDC058045 TaxID=3346311 RepID=UPI0036E7BE43